MFKNLLHSAISKYVSPLFRIRCLGTHFNSSHLFSGKTILVVKKTIFHEKVSSLSKNLIHFLNKPIRSPDRIHIPTIAQEAMMEAPVAVDTWVDLWSLQFDLWSLKHYDATLNRYALREQIGPKNRRRSSKWWTSSPSRSIPVSNFANRVQLLKKDDALLLYEEFEVCSFSHYLFFPSSLPKCWPKYPGH